MFVRREHGFALLIVLWTLVLISFLVTQLSAAARTEIRISGNLAANAAAQAAADGAIYEAIFNLSDPRAERRWPLDGVAHEIFIARSRITLRLYNEGARINPNLASPVLVEALLRVLGAGPERSAALAAAIVEWIGKDKNSRSLTAAQAKYQAAGLEFWPPGSPLESIDELTRIYGMTPDLFAALRPHLTLFGPAQPDPTGADPEVTAALALAGQLAPISGPSPQGAQDRFTVRIRALAQGPRNALATRTAVGRIGPELGKGYALLTWENSDE